MSLTNSRVVALYIDQTNPYPRQLPPGAADHERFSVRCAWHADKKWQAGIDPVRDHYWCAKPSCPAYNDGHPRDASSLLAAVSGLTRAEAREQLGLSPWTPEPDEPVTVSPGQLTLFDTSRRGSL